MTVEKLREELINRFENARKKEFDHIDTDFQNEKYLVEEGDSFFPYGRGLLNNGNEIGEGGILFLGYDWGDTETAKKVVEKNKELKKEGKEPIGEKNGPTLRNLLGLIGENPLEPVFLTNTYMGLRKKRGNIADYQAPYSNQEYEELCIGFLEFQIKNIKPRKIVTLGAKVDKFIRNNISEVVYAHKNILHIIHPCLLQANFGRSKLAQRNGWEKVSDIKTAIWKQEKN